MNPTHYTLEADGTLGAIVFPDGHEGEEVYPLPEGYWDRPMRYDVIDRYWEDDVEAERARIWELVKAKRDEVRYAGCNTPKGRMDSDSESQRKVNGAVTMAIMAGDAFSVDWTMQDNSVVAHNGPEMMAAGVAVGQHESVCHEVGRVLRDQVEAADSLEQLYAIDIEGAPWPT